MRNIIFGLILFVLVASFLYNVLFDFEIFVMLIHIFALTGLFTVGRTFIRQFGKKNKEP